LNPSKLIKFIKKKNAWEHEHLVPANQSERFPLRGEKKRKRRNEDIIIQSFIMSQFLSFLQVIAENLSEEEIMGMKEMFKSMDTDNSGTITFEELKAGLPKLGTKLSESEVKQLMEAVISLVFFIFCSAWA
jgi:uncharacterized protein YneF (UPF0154 family)